MLRDNLVGLIEPMPTARENDGSSLALSIHKQRQASDDRSSCLKNPRPAGAESSLTERTTSPFQTEPRHGIHPLVTATALRRATVTCGGYSIRLLTPRPKPKEASSRLCIAAQSRAWDTIKPSGPLPIDSVD